MKLTLPQQDIYYEQLIYPDIPIYNIGAKIEIKGDLKYEILNKAYQELINQHDSYRSYLINNANDVEVKIAEEFNKELEYLDFSLENKGDEKANDFMQNKMMQPFLLNKDKQLHHFILLKVTETHHYLFSVYHHIITDGWGTSLMFQRLVKNYNELFREKEIKTEYPYTYKDFVEDDSQYMMSEYYGKNKAYWVEKFEQLPEELLSLKSTTKTIPRSKRETLTIKRETYNLLTKMGKRSGGSTFHVILGILFLYFGRKHQNNDFAIGLPVLNRGKSIFKKTVGLFMGISPLRMTLNFEGDFEELVKAIRNQLRLDYRHQRFPLGKIIKELKLYSEKKRLFDMTLSYEKQNYADHFYNTTTKVIPLSHQSERVALAMYIREFDDSEDVILDFDYNLNYFDEAEIKTVTNHISNLINELIKASDKPLYSYAYLTKEEDKLLNEFNSTQYQYPLNETVIDAILEQVTKQPNKTAVEDGEEQYTFEQLNILSDKIAMYLLESSETNTPIAVLMNRSSKLIITLLGILKAGKAFIPLDPFFPEARLQYILQHTGVNQIIGNSTFKNTIQHNCEYISVEEVIKANKYNDSSINNSKILDTAYIIYTSGSTGNPKGVSITHKALLNFLMSMQYTPKIEEKDKLLSVTTQSFDISILEFFLPLLAGSTVFIARKEVLQEPEKIIKVIEENEITMLQATPSFFQMLFNSGWSGDKKLKILCGGDTLSISLAEKLVKNSKEVWNMYGPTETTIWSTCKKIEQKNDALSIGKPIHNTIIYILDKKLQTLPLGSIGGIYIGGDGIAQGYYKDKALTNERFIKNPFLPSEKIYDTGDLGKWTKNGEILFYGRNDNQVKIRGYRIELGDIETKLEAIDSVKSAIVVAKKNDNQDAFLIAYIIRENDKLSSKLILKILASQLPKYMIPSTIIEITGFPLTPNKKVNRKELAEKQLPVHSTKKTVQFPSSILEKQLHDIFKEVLQLQRNISIDENFFELGGHSLNAVKVVNAVEKKMNYKIHLETIFNYPKILSLSAYLEKEKTNTARVITPVPKLPYYPITFSQYAIWLASLQVEKSIAYNMFAAYQVKGEIEKEILDEVFSRIIKRHEVLRTNFIEIEGKPSQKINEFHDVTFRVVTFNIYEKNIKNELRDYANKEFNLEEDILLRVGIFKDENENSTLVFVTHHIIMDGWSLEGLISELKNKYIAISKNQENLEPKLGIQFKDYAVWQNQIENKSKVKAEDFWKQYLKGFQWQKLIEYDYHNTSKNYTGKFYEFHWEETLLQDLTKLAIKNHLTLHTLLAAAFNIVLHKLYQHKDICIGTINSGRALADINKHIGMFVKTLPLRTQIKADMKCSDLLQHVKDDIAAIDKYQDIPNSVMNDLRLEAILVLQNPTYDYDNITLLPNLELNSITIEAKYNRIPLLIDFSISNNSLQGSVHYDTEKYEEETITFLMLKLELLLKQMIKNIDSKLSDIDIDIDFEKEGTVDIDFNF